MLESPRLVLASASPRRAAILRDAGYTVVVRPVDAVEIEPGEGVPLVSVRENAERKAASAMRDAGPGEVVVAADTVLVLHDRWIGKPADREAGLEMLASLAGRPHDVATAVCIRRGDRSTTFVETTRVVLRSLEVSEIRAYHRDVSPLDKAGAYNIDEHGPVAGGVVESFDGSYTNVMGLPIERLGPELESFGLLPARKGER